MSQLVSSHRYVTGECCHVSSFSKSKLVVCKRACSENLNFANANVQTVVLNCNKILTVIRYNNDLVSNLRVLNGSGWLWF